MNSPDVTCIGEIIVDLISQELGKSLSTAHQFRKYAGGAPANVAIGLVKLGYQVAFIGRVGRDSFGEFLINYLKDHQVQTQFIFSDPKHKTRLAFISRDVRGERNFEFWEKQPADAALVPNDFDLQALSKNRMIHFGSLPLTRIRSRQVLLQVQDLLVSQAVRISFDPNYRPPLWSSPAEALRVLNQFILKSQIIKMNKEEAFFLSSHTNLANAAVRLFHPQCYLLAITLGADGCFLKTKNHELRLAAPEIKVVDTTGCGDAFMAALLGGLLQLNPIPDELSANQLIHLGNLANFAGAFTSSQLGAVEAQPKYSDIRIYFDQLSKR
jgi:fructokinase